MAGGGHEGFHQVQRPGPGGGGFGADASPLRGQGAATASGAARAHPADGEQARPIGRCRGGDLVGALTGGLVVAEFGGQRRGHVERRLGLILWAGRRRVRLGGVGVGLWRVGVGLVGAVGVLRRTILGCRVVGGRLGWGVVGIRLFIPQETVEEVLVEPRGVERVAAAAMRQRQQGGLADVGAGDGVASGPGGVRDRRAGGDDVGAQAVHLEPGTHAGDRGQRIVAELHPRQAGASLTDAGPQRGLVGGEGCGERERVGVEGEPPADDLDTASRFAGGDDLDGETEPVQQLGPQFALLRVHGADQDEAGGVLDGDAVAFDGGPAHGGGVQEQVDQVVVEEVDLVDVEDAAVGAREQAGLERHLTLGQGTFELEGTQDAVLGGAHREFDEPHRTRRAGGGVPIGQVQGDRGGIVGVDGEPVALIDGDGRQDGGQRAHGGGFGGALLAADQHPADLRGDRRQDEGQPHRVEVVGFAADDGRKGVLLWHVRLPLCSPTWSSWRGAGLRTGRVPFGLGSPQRACAGLSPASQILPVVAAPPVPSAVHSGAPRAVVHDSVVRCPPNVAPPPRSLSLVSAPMVCQA